MGRRLGFRQAMWLFPVAFALHVTEEAPGFTAWVERYASGRYTQADFVINNSLGLVFTVSATWMVWRFANNRLALFVYYSAVLTQQALFNTLFHAVATVAFGAYSPGVATGLILFLPIWYYLTRVALREGLLTRRTALVACVIGGLLHTGVIAQQVFFVQVP
jgi:Protein of unknown function with HXXEE motif